MDEPTLYDVLLTLEEFYEDEQVYNRYDGDYGAYLDDYYWSHSPLTTCGNLSRMCQEV